MTDWLNHPDVTANLDGTYTLDGELADHPWHVRPWPDGIGWKASCFDDSFGASRFATAADAIGAVLSDPAGSYVVSGQRWTTAECGLPEGMWRRG